MKPEGDTYNSLLDEAGNRITQGFLMAEELNMHFSSVFRREDTVRYMYQKHSSGDQRGKVGGVTCNPRSSS